MQLKQEIFAESRTVVKSEHPISVTVARQLYSINISSCHLSLYLANTNIKLYSGSVSLECRLLSSDWLSLVYSFKKKLFRHAHITTQPTLCFSIFACTTTYILFIPNSLFHFSVNI